MLTLALIAHDNKKADLVAWATFNRETLARFHLVGTRQTARLVRDKVGLEVEAMLGGPEGGDAPCMAMGQAAGAMAALSARTGLDPEELPLTDIRALLRVCNVHNVPVATNLSTADLIITGLTVRV